MAKGEKPGKEAKSKAAAAKKKPAAKSKAQGGSKTPATAKEPVKGAAQNLDDDWGQEFEDTLDGLNIQQTKFVMEYVKTRNAVQSYLEAYGRHLTYSAAGSSAHDLLKTPKVRKAIRIVANSIITKYKADPEFIIQELAKMAHVHIGHFLQIEDDGTATTDLSMADDDKLRAVEEYEVKEFLEDEDDASGEVGEDGKNKRRKGRKVKLKLVSRRAVLMDLAKLQKMFSDNFSPRAETAQIIQELEDGKLTLLEAGYRFTRLEIGRAHV